MTVLDVEKSAVTTGLPSRACPIVNPAMKANVVLANKSITGMRLHVIIENLVPIPRAMA
jgi:hypothetical protein